MSATLKIGTRGSKLAMVQSEWVKAKVEERHPGVGVELVRIKTTGDKILDSPLSAIGGKGLFVKEIEEALLRKDVDLAVHSMKDVPAELPRDLVLSSFPEREDPCDAFISGDGRPLEQLPEGARMGTSSLRRSAQLLHMRPDLEIVPLRGNVDTRLKRLQSGELEAIILAAAGLNRLGLADRITERISPEHILPAIGQGALGLEVRRHDRDAADLLEFLNDDATAVTVRAERAFLKELEGGCQVPVAAFAQLKGNVLSIRGMVAELDGSRIISDERTGEREDAERLGIALARRLLNAGAGEILDRVYARA